VGHVVELRYAHGYFFGKGNLKDHLEHPDVDSRLQLKLILKNYIVKLWTGSYGSRQKPVAISCEHCDENSGSVLTEW
jgi:hypothetical protein